MMTDGVPEREVSRASEAMSPELAQIPAAGVSASGGRSHWQARVLDNMTEGVSVTDAEGYILYTNAAEDRMFGYETGELLGQHVTVQNDYPPGENERLVRQVIDTLHASGTWEGERLNRRKDGTQFVTWSRITAAEFGGHKHWVCVRSDVTKARRLESAARHLAAIVESSSDAIVSKDLNGIVTSWNRGAQQLFGYTEQEMVGQPILRIAAPGRVDEMPAILNRIRRGEKIERYETQRRAKDGRILTVSLTISPVRNSEGQIVGASKIARDVTMQRRLERELSEREQELRTLLANLPDVVSRFDQNLRFKYVSPPVEQITGYPPEHFLGKTHEEAGLPPDIAGPLSANLKTVFETGQAGQIQFDYASPKLGPRTLYATVTPEFGADGKVVSALSVVRDLTERQRSLEAQRTTERELMLLIEASARLLSTPHFREVLQTIIELGQRFIAADAHAIWLRNNATGEWSVAQSSGLSAEFVKGASLIAGQGLPSEPMVFEDVATEPLLASRRESLLGEGVVSTLAIPLCIHGEPAGTITFYWRTRHPASASEIRISSALGNLAAAALGTADLYDRQIESRLRAERSERRSAFLAEAGEILSSSLQYETTLRNLARLAVPSFADWCAVDIVEEDGAVRRLTVEHSDPEKVRLAVEMHQADPPGEDDPARVSLRNGQSILIETITDEMLVRGARAPGHLKRLRELGLGSAMIAPMVLGGVSLGAITFASAESERRFTEADLQLAEEVARRAATAIAHARLYQNVQTSEERLRLAVEAGRLGVWERDLQTGEFSYSEQCKKNFGVDSDKPLSYEDVVGRLHKEDAERWRQEAERAVASGSTFGSEYRIFFPDGQQHWLLVHGRCVHSAEGQPLRMVGVTLDITGRKQIEQTLRRTNDDLLRANDDLNQFAYSASHDLQEPLRMMALYTQLLDRQYVANLDATAKEYIGFILHGAKRMEMLIKDLLSYTQTIEVSDEPIPPISADAVLDRVLLNLKPSIDEVQAIVERDPLPSVPVKDVHLLQLFQNLIGNALKYHHPEKQPRIAIRCEPWEEMWKFCIIDNGIGIPPSYLNQVFGIFKRLHTSDKYSGTGIGLAICQRIVERYGGKIWVESDESSGSTFCFTLPA